MMSNDLQVQPFSAFTSVEFIEAEMRWKAAQWEVFRNSPFAAFPSPVLLSPAPSDSPTLHP
jgi:hypothetical protein